MKARYIVVAIGAVVVIGLLGLLILNPTASKVTPSGTPGSTTPATETSSSQYVEYSRAQLDLGSNKRRVLFFYADWCPTCRPADANFKANLNNIPKDVVIIRVNYNDSQTDQEEKELATQYGITYQHTYVQIDSSGDEVTKWNGGALDELLANIK